MIGFFEHQYLKFKKRHVHNLIALAKSDGKLHDDEEKLIYRIGEKYRLKDRQIASLINSTKPRDLYIPETHKEKMDQLYDLLMMVHADGVVDLKEIHFCEIVADKFGYKKKIIQWMLRNFESKPPAGEEWQRIIDEGEKEYLK